MNVIRFILLVLVLMEIPIVLLVSYSKLKLIRKTSCWSLIILAAVALLLVHDVFGTGTAFLGLVKQWPSIVIFGLRAVFPVAQQQCGER